MQYAQRIALDVAERPKYRYVNAKQGDSDLVAGNIKSGISIFGVTGTYSGGGSGEISAVTGTSSNITSSSGTTTQIMINAGIIAKYIGISFAADGSGAWGYSSHFCPLFVDLTGSAQVLIPVFTYNGTCAYTSMAQNIAIISNTASRIQLALCTNNSGSTYTLTNIKWVVFG